jgi:hypothetical protein
MKLKIPNNYLEINYSYYIKNYEEESDLSFNLEKYNKIKGKLIKQKNTNIQIKFSKIDNLINLIESNLNIDLSKINKNYILNSSNVALSGNNVDLNVLFRLLKLKDHSIILPKIA